jgi:hypothetical protein
MYETSISRISDGVFCMGVDVFVAAGADISTPAGLKQPRMPTPNVFRFSGPLRRRAI